uniref:Uncharacterized protein n=1 Tax=Arundo donax TaxID=35708 RepID=A0A0A8Y4R7_ARUDO
MSTLFNFTDSSVSKQGTLFAQRPLFFHKF